MIKFDNWQLLWYHNSPYQGVTNSSEDELAIIYEELELSAHTEEMIKFIIDKSKESIKEFENNENMGLKLHK